VPRIGSSADVGYRGLVVDDANNEKFTVAGRRTQLEGELFGIGFTNPMAAADYRDAPDRAEQCAEPRTHSSYWAARLGLKTRHC
jgi:hypothetical protein